MGQRNGFDPNDPIGNLRKARDATLDAWAKAMIDLVNTETFARWIGATLELIPDCVGAAAAVDQRVDEDVAGALESPVTRGTNDAGAPGDEYRNAPRRHRDQA
ncbi:MAG: hypothetical protein RMJ48_03360 [Roseiflexaceae bacterium]|nr:hypothetical protein [Roseiflexaceae bacterium]